MALVAAITIMIFIFHTTVDAKNMIRAFDSNVNIPEDCLKILNEGKYSYDIAMENYCIEKPSNYPQEHVDRYVQHMQTIGFPEQQDSYEENVYSDDPCDEEEHKNCCSKTKMEQPFFVKSESTLKLVIQSKFFQQKVKSTECRDGPQTSCFEDFNLELWGWQTECRNNMGTTKLYVYNSATNATESVDFSFPVSCSCSGIRNTMNNSDNK